MGVVALVALVLAAAVAAWVDPQPVGAAVTRGMARALCVVSGGFCDADRAPCVTASRSDADGWHVNLAILRYGEGGVLLREERSDGTVALTRTRDRSGGLDVGVGADLRVDGLSLGAELRAAILARLGAGRPTSCPPSGPGRWPSGSSTAEARFPRRRPPTASGAPTASTPPRWVRAAPSSGSPTGRASRTAAPRTRPPAGRPSISTRPRGGAARCSSATRARGASVRTRSATGWCSTPTAGRASSSSRRPGAARVGRPARRGRGGRRPSGGPGLRRAPVEHRDAPRPF